MSIKKRRYFRTVEQDGATYSIDGGGGYWGEIADIICREKFCNVLLLGIAGGTIARLVKQKDGGVVITGVDIEYPQLGCESYFDDIIISSAMEALMAFCEARQSFDCVVIDIYKGFASQADDDIRYLSSVIGEVVIENVNGRVVCTSCM